MTSTGASVAPPTIDNESPQQFCVENPAGTYTQWLMRSSFSSAGVETKEWSSNGTAWSTTVPTGTIRAGQCADIGGTAGGLSWTGTAVKTIPTTTMSFSVSANVGSFDVSFDAGATWVMTACVGTRTWGYNNRPIANAAQVRVRGTNATSQVDLIWSTNP